MKLFERGMIGKMKLKNRIAMAPMGVPGLQDLDHGFSRRLIGFYEARASGGVGMIISTVNAVNVDLEGGITAGLVRLTGPEYMIRLNELCDTVHHYGAKLVVQLTPGFGRVNSTMLNTIPLISASAVPCFYDPSTVTRPMTIGEIQKLVGSFAASVAMAKMAGVDAVEIHGYGGYLLDQFQTALWNKRTDEYGGDLDGRLRFSMEIIGASRAVAGPDFPLIYKFTPDHLMEGGRKLEEGLEVVKRLEEAGVDALHIVGGCYEVWHKAQPSMYEPPASHVNLAAAVKNVVKIPVITDGKLGRPDVAEKVIAEGKADFIALGRPLLADPEWANKAKEGRVEDIRPCIVDSECIHRGYEMKYLSCAINPTCAMEREYILKPAQKRKHVLVIGGGPGGLEAARVAAIRGHQVTLWEKESKLGGNLLPASVPEFKRDIRPLIDYFSIQIKKLDVKVELNKKATPDLVQKLKPEVVIIAAGAGPLIPQIPGIKGDNVFSAVDVLLGKKNPGTSVIVAGGGLVGCETAAYLAGKGKKVTIVEMMGKLIPAGGLSVNSMMGLMNLVNECGVKVLTGTRLLEVTATGVVIESNGSKEEQKASSVILALGFKSENVLLDELEGKVPELFAIGDYAKPRNILNAIWEGFHASRII